jgi:MYXO-CTERM domain-containing protein
MRIPALLLLLWTPAAYTANPPTPSAPHPRVFLNQTRLAALRKSATQSGTAAADLVKACQRTIDNPQDYGERGGSDGDTWPASALACAFSYVTTQNAMHLQQAIKFWRASLDDDQTIGDQEGCKPGVDTNWQSWDGNPPAPPVIRTITHDTGYPMRWYGPYVALTYDWLHHAPGVDNELRGQTQTCLTNWIDYYSQRGYHHEEPGANYNAGFVIGKTLGAIALGSDIGADGDRLWKETLDDLFGALFVGDGLKNANGPGAPAGVMVGGDWAEGWQYGPLSVLEYAAATLAVEEQGAPQPVMDEWTTSLMLRYIHGTLPALDGQYVGGGDFDDENVYIAPSLNTLDAVLLGASDDAAASWAQFYKQMQAPSKQGRIWNALAETREVAPVDYRAQTPPPPLWYLARGTRALYARSGWDEHAFWAVFQSEPQVVSDHLHFAASNFVFSRGVDHLIVDPSRYGEPGSLATNAVTADSDRVRGDYAPSQTPWSEAELVWARATPSGTYAARSDFAKAFAFADQPSDIPYARREWVMLPEGEIVTIDRVHTADADHNMYVSFHTHTGGTLTGAGCVATGTVGSSQVAIHQVLLSEGGTAKIFHPKIGECSGSYPFGTCTNARFDVDDYSLKVPGPFAVAIHVIDGLGAGEVATVGSLGDDDYDPAPKLNGGVMGAAVYRGGKQSYVVASSAVDGASPATMTYGVPRGASRHIAFDAPEDASGQSAVTAAKGAGGRCVVTIAAGAGFAGRPLIFRVDDTCTAAQDADVTASEPPPGSGKLTCTSGGLSQGSGCGCAIGGASSRTQMAWLAILAIVFALYFRRRGRRDLRKFGSSRGAG